MDRRIESTEAQPTSKPAAEQGRATLLGHPLHPMIIPFPIAFLIGALGADLAFAFNGDPFWARSALRLLGAGFVSGILAGLVGTLDFMTATRARRVSAGWIHMFGNVTVLVLAAANYLLRLEDAAGYVLPTGLLLSLVTTVLLIVTGWYGGELSYRHRIGVAPDGEDSHDDPRRRRAFRESHV